MTIESSQQTSESTLVGFHDLLGFGQLLASSGGTLDSAVGGLAYRRILALRDSIIEVEDAFPQGTMFFHFNDTVTAYLDVNIQIRSSHTDPEGIGCLPFERAEAKRVFHFLAACATLHQRSIAREDEERIGPAGRTFVVLGERWILPHTDSKRIFEVPPLQANLAFAEAYLADRGGSQVGFEHRTHNRLYVNDYVWFVLSTSKLVLTQTEQQRLTALGTEGQDFPLNLCLPNAQPIRIDIFHRRRTFRSLMAHHACDIATALD